VSPDRFVHAAALIAVVCIVVLITRGAAQVAGWLL
jgi:hypothetical protein